MCHKFTSSVQKNSEKKLRKRENSEKENFKFPNQHVRKKKYVYMLSIFVFPLKYS